ncbi:GPI mannosyltransferase 4-like [Uloborus diversus]|uniref:GPI mannosyltransferase 4-like n=1 Tax=Uloborus diversus TaxID=327109 RepID=UPI00240A4569|nr:GPI mannosyltransferase 4-like [Uloborus diversus]
MTPTLYMLLCAARFILVFIPQTGYIHPDEHFQGPEIVYGDMLNFAVHRTWEFNSLNPIRSIFFPYLITGIASLLSLLIDTNYLYGTKWYPYLLLILPRVLLCFLSFANDFCLYMICKMLKRNHSVSLTVFASSYVTIVYLTRTFSNSIEALIFTFFVFLLCEIRYLFDKINEENLSNSKLRKLLLVTYMLGITLTLGIFNRPTFICFAIYPLTVWIYSLSKTKCNCITKLKLFCSFCLSILSLSICLISIDSFYYTKGNFLFNIIAEKNLKGLVLTPVNFLLYNTNKANLGAHGLHPLWLHICVNIPLLFSVYGVVILLHFLKILRNTAHKWDYMFHVLLFVTPLLLLSLIPHQEPRFLVPLITPLSLLCSYHFLHYYLKNKFFICLWCIFNIGGVIFYGFFHQGGVFLSLSHIHTFIHAQNNSVVVYYKTFMPPYYLLAMKEKHLVGNIHDFSGKELSELQFGVENIVSGTYPDSLFIVVPFELSISVQNFSIFSKYKYVQHDYFFPHLSTEHIPKLSKMINTLKDNSTLTKKVHNLKKIFSISILRYTKL